MGSLLPAPPSPSPSRRDAAPSGTGQLVPQTPAAFDMNDYINVSPSPAVVVRPSGLPLSQLSQSSTLPSSSASATTGTLSAHARKGYATEATRALMAHARATMGLEHFTGVTDADNVAAQKVPHRPHHVIASWVRLLLTPPGRCSRSSGWRTRACSGPRGRAGARSSAG